MANLEKKSKSLMSNKNMMTIIIFSIVFFLVLLMFWFLYSERPDSTTVTVMVSAISALLGVVLTMGVTQIQLERQTEREKLEEKADDARNEVKALKERYDAEIKALKESQDAEISRINNDCDKTIKEAVQQKEEEMRNRFSKESILFQQRLKIYQDYMEMLCRVIGKGPLTDHDKLELQFQTSYIAMHTNSEHIESISEKVKEIVSKVCGTDNSGSTEILDPLFRMVYAFREELYSKEECTIDESRLTATRSNFKYAFMDNLADETAEGNNEDNDTDSVWGKAVKKWFDKGWSLTFGKDGNWFALNRTDKRPGNITGGFRGGKPYIQTSITPSDWDFAQWLKNKSPEGISSSNRSYGFWRTGVNDDFQTIKEGEMMDSLNGNDAIATTVVRLIDCLIERHDESILPSLVRTELLDNLKMDRKHWSTPEIYLFSTLFSNYETGTDLGTLFWNLCVEEGERRLVLGRRNGKGDGISLIRWIIGLEDSTAHPVNDNNHIILERFPLNADIKETALSISNWCNIIVGKVALLS